MNQFSGFDEQNNGSGIFGILAGMAAGTGLFLLGAREWWAWGWGPGNWSRSEILHAYWLAFWGSLNPSYEGDLGTWSSLRRGLLSHHEYDAFVASFWGPFLLGSIVGLLTGFLVVKALGKKDPAYIRGSRIN